MSKQGIFVTELQIHYEGSRLLGVYSTLESAQKRCSNDDSEECRKLEFEELPTDKIWIAIGFIGNYVVKQIEIDTDWTHEEY